MRAVAAVAALGAIDTASFMWSRRGELLASPGRLGGSVVGLTLWGGLSAAALRGDRGVTRGLATANAAANALLLAVHLRHRIATPRVFVSAGLAAGALGAAAAGV